MSSLLRATARATVRPAMRTRAPRNVRTLYEANAAKGKAFVAEEEAIEHHAHETAALWYKLSLFLALPLCTVALVRSYREEVPHIRHIYHEAEHYDEDAAPPEFIYQNIRNKDFFWGDGDKTSFWSPANHHKR
ncbi:cytochrome c oxidase, subunit VIa [Limtongia smithiae]|uniref:cytochrome c oxidase, subunit VIa n=1 Tax=Limtongia smithiae TaxID=1125753 RepID=UPI0034CD11E1